MDRTTLILAIKKRTSEMLLKEELTYITSTTIGIRRATFVIWLVQKSPFWIVQKACKFLGDFGAPQIDVANGITTYEKCGKLHRLYGPARIIRESGESQWWQNGMLHRDDDLPAVVCANGTTMWYVNGLRHRDKWQPAVITRSWKQLWENGVFLGNI